MVSPDNATSRSSQVGTAQSQPDSPSSSFVPRRSLNQPPRGGEKRNATQRSANTLKLDLHVPEPSTSFGQTATFLWLAPMSTRPERLHREPLGHASGAPFWRRSRCNIPSRQISHPLGHRRRRSKRDSWADLLLHANVLDNCSTNGPGPLCLQDSEALGT